MNYLNSPATALQSKVGGVLKENLILVSGLNTFPAFCKLGTPSIPTTDNWGLHVLFKTHSNGLVDTG